MRTLSTKYATLEDVVQNGLGVYAEQAVRDMLGWKKIYTVQQADVELIPLWQISVTENSALFNAMLETCLRQQAELKYSPDRWHAFWVTAQDELDDLSPAEMLAGLPFDTRQLPLYPSQERSLQQHPAKRLDRVQRLLESGFDPQRIV